MDPGEQGVVFGLGHFAQLAAGVAADLGEGRVELGVDLRVRPLTVADHHLGAQKGERRDEPVHLAQPHLLQDLVHLRQRSL